MAIANNRANKLHRAAILSCARVCAQGLPEALQAEAAEGSKPSPDDPLGLSLRARADAAASHKRYADALLASLPQPLRATENDPPEQQTQARLQRRGHEYTTALIRARAEALGARWLPGMAVNLMQLPPPPEADAMAAVQAMVSSWLREADGHANSHANSRANSRAHGPAPHHEARQQTELPPLPALAPALREQMPQLLKALNDEHAYVKLAQALGLALADADQDRLRPSGGLMRWLNPRARPLRNRHLVAASGQAARSRAPEDPTGIEQPVDALPEDERPDQGRASNSALASPTESPRKDPGQEDPGPPLPHELSEHYRVFTRAHDQVTAAEHLASAEERERLRRRLDRAAAPYRHVMLRLAHRLQRRILAGVQPRWQLEQDEGELDPARLTQLLSRPLDSQIFRRLEDAPGGPTAVTLLIDNSGSMRGHPITIAAITVDLLAQTLERCRIPTEILGYTTTDRRHSAAYQDWLAAGRPPQPGRLNGLQHIVYKAMDTPWRRGRRDLGVMLKDDLLRENIDGEALWWAAQRLMRRPEPRRLLMVISDGAPRDTDTLAHNPGHYLDRHLHQVVQWITQRSTIQLHAIGIGHAVDRYYPQAVTIRQVEALGEVLTRRVGDWLTGTGRKSHL